MSIIDRARDALKHATPGPWELDYTHPKMNGDTWNIRQKGAPSIRISGFTYGRNTDAELAALSPELAVEAVRMHEKFSDLADEYEKIAKRCASEGDYDDHDLFLAVAARIRTTLEGTDQ